MIENTENHIAYTCKCGGVNFAMLKSGGIECNKCSTTLDGVKWWSGGIGAQIARAIKAEDALLALQVTQQAATAWLPIESAPKFKEVLVWRDDSRPFYEWRPIYAAPQAVPAEPSCPDCHAPHLLYECVHCSASNYPAAPVVKESDMEPHDQNWIHGEDV